MNQVRLFLAVALLCTQSLALAGSTKLKKGTFLQIQSHDLKTPQIITPKEEPTLTPKDAAYFEIAKEKDQLILRYHTNDPNLHLSRSDSIVIELLTDFPFKVEPSLIITENWPKNATQIPLKPKTVPPHSKNRILGKAAFTYCHQKTLACTHALTTIAYFYTP